MSEVVDGAAVTGGTGDEDTGCRGGDSGKKEKKIFHVDELRIAEVTFVPLDAL